MACTHQHTIRFNTVLIHAHISILQDYCFFDKLVYCEVTAHLQTAFVHVLKLSIVIIQ